MITNLSKILDFHHFFITFNTELWVNTISRNGILKCFLCWFKGFLEVWGWVKILSKIIIKDFHDCRAYGNFRIWSPFQHSHFWLVNELQLSKWYSKVFFCWWRISGSLRFEVKLKFFQKLKIFMTAVLSEISDFDHFFITFNSDLWVNYNSQNGILKCSFVHLKDFWKFNVGSIFCQT